MTVGGTHSGAWELGMVDTIVSSNSHIVVDEHPYPCYLNENLNQNITAQLQREFIDVARSNLLIDYMDTSHVENNIFNDISINIARIETF